MEKTALLKKIITIALIAIPVLTLVGFERYSTAKTKLHMSEEGRLHVQELNLLTLHCEKPNLAYEQFKNDSQQKGTEIIGHIIYTADILDVYPAKRTDSPLYDMSKKLNEMKKSSEAECEAAKTTINNDKEDHSFSSTMKNLF
jgi:hypothetical protein